MAAFDFSPHGDTPPAPGDLELLQRFLNLHVHDAEGTHAIRNLILAGDDEPVSPRDADVLDRIGLASGLHPHFHAAHAPTLEPKGTGVAAAYGAIVAIAFVSAFDGSFDHLKLCADETCRSVFYDRSKNRSGRWCSMSTCGNRAKVRAWRERQRADG
jgi:predicted RNA-binding Zn ribbon-like protein